MSITRSDVRPGQPSPVRPLAQERPAPPPNLETKAFHWTCKECNTFNVCYMKVDEAGNLLPGTHNRACVKCALNYDGPLMPGDQPTDPDEDEAKLAAEAEDKRKAAAQQFKAQADQTKAEAESKGPPKPSLPAAPQPAAKPSPSDKK